MNRYKDCCPLIIIEGPDGSGKTSLANDLCTLMGGRYQHLGPLKHVSSGLARIYHEAMLPALLGYQPVIMDRAWHSELPYGCAFRQGQDRLGRASRRMLERVAMRCGAVVIHCDGTKEDLLRSFNGRKQDEYLDGEEELLLVRRLYHDAMAESALPVINYSYRKNDAEQIYMQLTQLSVDPLVYHQVSVKSAGNRLARVLMVGEGFADHKDPDPLHQFPFVSYSHAGCSQWLTHQLDAAGVPENELCWLNADQTGDIGTLISEMPELELIITLGKKAAETITHVMGMTVTMPPVETIEIVNFEHPQYSKRFLYDKTYPLAHKLRDFFNPADVTQTRS